jgi:hypothetical protein
MIIEKPRIWPRILAFAVASLAVWATAVAWLLWYLPRMVAEEYSTGARTSTDGDSIGIPLFSSAILLAAVLIIANLAVAGFLIWRRRVRPPSQSRAAV